MTTVVYEIEKLTEKYDTARQFLQELEKSKAGPQIYTIYVMNDARHGYILETVNEKLALGLSLLSYDGKASLVHFLNDLYSDMANESFIVKIGNESHSLLVDHFERGPSKVVFRLTPVKCPARA